MAITMTKPRTELSSLPLELRDLIWEYTLPPPRLFTLDGLFRVRFSHFKDAISRVYEAWFEHQEVGGSHRVEPRDTTHCFDFRERHLPPITTQICRESRGAAARAGYFLLPAWDGSHEDTDLLGEGPGAAWFGGATDILYLEGSRVPFLLSSTPFHIPNAVRVRSVGVDWRYVQGGTRASPEVWDSYSSMISFQRRLLALYAYAPGLTRLLLVRPGVRDDSSRQSETCGEDLNGDGRLEARLVPLPLSTPIQLVGGDHTLEHVLGELKVMLGAKAMRRRWDEVYASNVAFPPEMVGCDVSWVAGAC